MALHRHHHVFPGTAIRSGVSCANCSEFHSVLRKQAAQMFATSWFVDSVCDCCAMKIKQSQDAAARGNFLPSSYIFGLKDNSDLDHINMNMSLLNT